MLLRRGWAISVLGISELPELRLFQQRQKFVQQRLDVVQAFRDLGSLHGVFVKVLVECTGGVEQVADFAVAGFGPQPSDCNEVVPVTAVLPAALFGDGLEDLDRSAPALFGGLWQIAIRPFPSGLRQEMFAGLLVLLGGHVWVPL